ncbi:prohead protease [Microcystis phage Mwe-Yong1]|nr:prohead protease [Microcystis phage Mwe-Yong1]
MKTETKSILVEKMDDAGHGLARLATLSSVDHDNDTYAPGAFGWKEGGEQWVPILPAHNRGAMPIGKSRVYEDGGVAFAELHLNLDTAAGKEWQSHLKFDLAKGKPAQEWSYGFGTLDASWEQRGDDRIRVLKRVDVHEVSPVIRGAGIGTATLSMKGQAGGFGAQLDAVIAEIDDVIERAGGIAQLRAADGRGMSKARLDQLAELKARLDRLVAADAPQADAVADALAAEFMTFEARRRIGR